MIGHRKASGGSTPSSPSFSFFSTVCTLARAAKRAGGAVAGTREGAAAAQKAAAAQLRQLAVWPGAGASWARGARRRTARDERAGGGDAQREGLAQ